MIAQRFEKVFDKKAQISGFTPGRVNLIGEHTDYNGGMVLPTALPLGVSIAFSPRNDDRIQIWSDKFEDLARRKTDDAPNDHWSDYIVGAVKMAIEAGYLKRGADIAVETNLPFGAGISSSAAVTVGLLKLARDLAGSTSSEKEIAILARRVENEYIGMPCGIMDQMAVAIAHPGQALALDTNTLNYQLIDLPTTHDMAVIHSGQFRQLNEGRYKERKEECDAIKVALGRENICQMTDVEFASLSSLPNTLRRRARHCMTEHRRTVEAVTCLRDSHISRLGELMNESHVSMREDFEITIPPVDALVADAISFGGIGARQTGGGFGGCIVACIERGKRQAWQSELLSKHTDAFLVC
ncbi:galactokinase [Litorimonas cladophorae]|uniref:Galactokinase n=1 Tax=Litorimonas cladophorae TaxID=1220491 RepID=A0A918KP90_9PROT|nr:galactokinase [Litorimonas cladophorae]GGX70844.1 galactokinase [Litorimonas cladophorae]